MKLIKLLLYLLIYSTINSFAQEAKNPIALKLEWQAVQEWTIGTNIKKVISFSGAQYPTELQLPYFNKRIEIKSGESYNIEILNPQYIPLTSEELALFPSTVSLTETPEITSQRLTERGNNSLDILVLPFVKQSDKILKLASFELKISKNELSSKLKAATKHSYTNKSVLANGKFIKIKISESGVYKLTYEDLNSMGIVPANVRIFGYGGGVLEQSFMLPKLDDLPENSIYMEKGSDGVFNAGDYILFYAKGVNKWTYDKTKAMFTHTTNTYSSYGYYFVTSDAGIGKKIETIKTQVPENASTFPITEFVDYKVFEEDIYSLATSGKEFYGKIFEDKSNYSINFAFRNPVLTNSTKVCLDVAAYSNEISSFELKLGGNQAQTLQVSRISLGDSYEKGKAANGIYNFTPQNETLNFSLSYNKPSSISVGYLNYLEVTTRRYLKMTGSVMQFQSVDYLGMNAYNKFQISDADSKIQIWDITDAQNIQRIATEIIDGKLTFTDSSIELKTYLAIDPTAVNSFAKPEKVGVVPNQNLHGIQPAELVILTHPNFLDPAQRLAQAHRDIDQMRVAVVTTDEVYNEFSSGTPDATAYRWVMKMLYDRALESGKSSDLPKYLLLFGRGTYDNRKLRGLDTGENLILTYQAENSLVQTLSYVTDDYFAFLDDNEGTQVISHLLDLGVGRFPVTTTVEANNVVDKTIAYMENTEKGIWKNQLCFVADDGDAALHMKQADSVANVISRNNPAYHINKIYLDSYVQEISASGESYPLARTNLHDLLRKGLLYLNYTGHAGNAGWTNENILTVNDIKSQTNKQLPLWMGATCDFLQFDLKLVSAGEQVVLNPYGGGIGIYSAARPVYASQNFTINRLFSEQLFKKQNGQHYRVGDVVAYSKNNIGSEINKLCYIYMGDPALKLQYPTNYNIKTTLINDKASSDTIRAMSVVKVNGIIEDSNGAKVSNFNGDLYVEVFDKVQTITTLNNEKDGNMTYKYRPNILFAGKANVTNGDFSISFMIPKDIKYNYGGGRINYYANDDLNKTEAQGYFENFIVGGTNLNVTNDNTGPDMQLFLNSESFVSGGQVNESPVFIAKLVDNNGINRVGSGIGHDLMLTIDNDPRQSYVLNDYFQSVLNSYSSGEVRYKLNNLENGKHTLTFRAWDLLNNSNTQSIDFEVIKGLTPNIFKVYNFPNPVKTNTRIIVDHDRPETVLNTRVDIFDLSGRTMWSFEQSNADIINWNLLGNDGRKVSSGIYLYRVSIKTKDSETFSKTNKMFITE